MVIWERFVDYNTIQFEALPSRAGEKIKGRPLASDVCAFDIEATRFEDVEQSAMYIWQFSISNRIVIVGRTWEEFLHMLSCLKERLDNLYLRIYVHSLRYEFQFLAGIYKFMNSEVFATDSREILKCTMYDTFEFRCSHRLFNMSLDAVTRKFNCTYRKRSGEQFDYNKKRISTTPITRKELLYCVYDVLGLVECIKAQLELYDDTLYTIPFTQTGYVRREAKRLMRPEHHEIQDCFPDLELFNALRDAFRGGNTHCNRYFSGEILHKVHGRDVSSEYPAQQVLEQYPRTRFEKVGYASFTPRYIRKMIERGNAVLMIVELENIRLKTFYDGFPYIPYAKCIGKPKDFELDNGRILRARSLKIALTDIDFKIIEGQYIFDSMIVCGAWVARYGPMYDGIIELNKKLFIEKTTLKGQGIYYDKAKEQLNAIYGMSCQNPINVEILFNMFEYERKKSDEAELLLIAKRGAFLTYQMGVWTTAHARAELQGFIDRAGERAVYCDTDSLMYLGDVDFEDFNQSYRERSTAAGAVATDPSGKVRYMGTFDSEDVPGAGCKYERFVSLGAKRYAFEKGGSGELGITVAGVSKKHGAAELKKKGGLEAFQAGLVWEDSGKLEAVYNDEPFHGPYYYKGERIVFTPNVTLRPTSYTVNLTPDYEDLLLKCTPEELEQGIVDFIEFMQDS